MNLSREMLESIAAESGFRANVLEKIAFLLAILEGINRHPFLKGKLALKGGTALNLFLADVPRLSVDIDLNYIGAEQRESMLAERPSVEHAIAAVCQREGLTVGKVTSEHAGGSWILRYKSVFGNTDSLKVDVIYMLRVPLWPATVQDSHRIGSLQARQILVLDEYELAAGKLCALLARQTSRDLYDTRHLLTSREMDRARLRLAFVTYGAINRKDWREVTSEGIKASARDAENNLIPLLRHTMPSDPVNYEEWINTLLTDCRVALECVLPLGPHETEFLDRLLDAGDIVPELLTSDAAFQDRVRRHPSLAWKAQNVRKHLGIT